MTKKLPSNAQPLQKALALHKDGKLSDAEAIYRQILRSEPYNFDALHLWGVVLLQRGDGTGAVQKIKAALSVNTSPAAYNNLGNAYRLIKAPSEALTSFQAAIAIDPKFYDAIVNSGITLVELGHYEEALTSFGQAIICNSANAQAFFRRGNILRLMRRYDEALKDLNQAILLAADFIPAFLSRGNLMSEMQQPELAIADYSQAIALDPKFAEAYNNRANILQGLNRREEALSDYRRAISLKPNYAESYNNLGNVLLDLKKFDEAASSYAQALAIDPEYNFTEGALIYTRFFLCDWSSLRQSAESVIAGVRQGKTSSPPFPLLSIPGSTAADQLKCSQLYVEKKYPTVPPLWKGEQYSHERIRVAYLSADFHEHATAYLLAGVFEAHDRAKFDIIALSFGRDDGSPTRSRLKASFTEFIDVTRLSDAQIAQLMREREIDIAVDLKGFTHECRFGIFAHRAAPVQVNYLGYPGSLGADCIDYIIADKIVIPSGEQKYYTEKIVQLPDCYQPNDNKREIAVNNITRDEAGLPEKGFVFCSFNNCYKITPDVFDIWMRLLQTIDGSVMWMLDAHPRAKENLVNEAEKRGIPAHRLIFAPRMKPAEHLARHRLADLFLDTSPYNAHTTAADALWAGLPVLTCMGQTFASRVAGSILLAAGMPELITHSLSDYEKMARSLATIPESLASMKEKLARNRGTCALFDTRKYAKNLEDTYIKMWQRTQSGLSPDNISGN